MKKKDFESNKFIDTNSIDEDSPLKELIAAATFASKPFGIIWDFDIMEDFLKKLGYNIIERYYEENDEYYKIAIKSDLEYIENNGISNIPQVFDLEVQKLLSKWLLSLK